MGSTLLAAGGMDEHDIGRVESQKFACSPDPGGVTSRRYPSPQKLLLRFRCRVVEGE